MLAPYSEITRSKAASASGICSALAWISGKRSPKRSCKAAAVASCAAELSRPTGRAPRRASHAEIYPVPQPSSRLSAPARPGGKTPAAPQGPSTLPTPVPRPPSCAARTGVVSGQPVPGHPVAQHMIRRASHTPSVLAAGQPRQPPHRPPGDNPDCSNDDDPWWVRSLVRAWRWLPSGLRAGGMTDRPATSVGPSFSDGATQGVMQNSRRRGPRWFTPRGWCEFRCAERAWGHTPMSVPVRRTLGRQPGEPSASA